MRNLVLHIGHGKTGTSYIQSVLAMNTTRLLDLNIKYPSHISLNEAKRGKVTSGNGLLILDEEIYDIDNHAILLSGEHLFHRLLENDNLKKSVIRKFENTTVILYTRNVYDMNLSLWGQHVKRHGMTSSLNKYMKNHSDVHFSKVLQWIKMSLDYKIDLKIFNYSNHSQDIIDHFFSVIAETLNLRSSQFEKFKLPAQSFVNRSLSYFEYKLIRILNSISPVKGRKTSDFLVNQLPFIPSYSPKISAETRILLEDKYGKLVEDINYYLNDSELIKI